MSLNPRLNIDSGIECKRDNVGPFIRLSNILQHPELLFDMQPMERLHKDIVLSEFATLVRRHGLVARENGRGEMGKRIRSTEEAPSVGSPLHIPPDSMP